MYNSELDSLRPRPVSDLIQLVEREEREKLASSASASPAKGTLKNKSKKAAQKADAEATVIGSKFHRLERNADPSLVEKERKAYLLEHKRQFDELVERARQNRTRTRKAEREVKSAGDDDAQPTNAQDVEVSLDEELVTSAC